MNPLTKLSSGVFGSRCEADVVHVRKVKQWVRQASHACEGDTILVTELACSEPGCPPFEVLMAVLSEGGKRRQRKLHLPLVDVSEAHVIATWQSAEHVSAPR